MQTFAYQRPATVREAVAAATAADTRLIAGGQSLLPAMKLGLASPQSLVDLGAIAGVRSLRPVGKGSQLSWFRACP